MAQSRIQQVPTTKSSGEQLYSAEITAFTRSIASVLYASAYSAVLLSLLLTFSSIQLQILLTLNKVNEIFRLYRKGGTFGNQSSIEWGLKPWAKNDNMWLGNTVRIVHVEITVIGR
jgi:hypothetical protein